MKKINRRIFTAIIVALIVFSINNSFKGDIWEINADKLKQSFQPISGDAVIDDLTQWTPFEWDVVYSFAPYTSKEVIYETIGYKWSKISATVSEGMNQIVFMKDGKVVCYLYGYPENTKIWFNLGVFEGSYIRLTSEEKLSFLTTVSENGVRYLRIIK